MKHQLYSKQLEDNAHAEVQQETWTSFASLLMILSIIAVNPESPFSKSGHFQSLEVKFQTGRGECGDGSVLFHTLPECSLLVVRLARNFGNGVMKLARPMIG